MITDKERIAQLRLINTENIGAVTYHKLIKHFGSAEKALENLPPRFTPFAKDKAEAELKKSHKIGCHLISYDDETYPQMLKHIADAPPIIYALGNIELLNHTPSVAIVGSRNATVNGRKMASRIAYELTEENVIVVSGMARGIDSSAHKGALYAKGQQGATIAVLGTGVDIVYPEENVALYKQIIKQGLIISEFPLGTTPQAQNFPRRNRIVAGISSGTLVVEANLQSGSLITARLALEQNRDVFAVPGSPLESRSSGTNKLIKEGAILVDSAEDILPHLSKPLRPLPQKQTPPEQELFDNLLDKDKNNVDIPQEQEGENLLDYLSRDGTYIDDIIRQSGLDSGTLSAKLLDLELEGKIERLPGNKVALLKK